MPQLLIRDVPEETHARIVASAAAAGRSMQAELLATIQDRYAPRYKRSLVDILLSAGGDDEGEIEIVRDTRVRDFSFGGEG